jgi:[ribosomal protein S5]-alanine N-acetyltransferase
MQLNTPIINTTRLTLVGITSEVLHQAFTQGTQQQIQQFFGVDEAGYQQLLLQHHKGVSTFRINQLYFLLKLKNTETIIGNCGYHTWNATHKRAELFYNITQAQYLRQGFTTEAVHAVLKYGFNTMQLHRVQANTAKDNIASIAVINNFGFTYEGIARQDYVLADGSSDDSMCFSLLVNEYVG